MAHERADTVALLRADFHAEAEAGFPRLSRVPQTKVIQFLDYFGDLGPTDRTAFLEALARRGSVLVNPGPGSRYPPAPAFDHYWKTINSPGAYSGGYRYCDVKFLAAVPKIAEFGSYEGWVENTQRPWVSERALQPREDLLPDMSLLKPVKGATLRRRVKATLEAEGFTVLKARGAELKYVHASGSMVRVDFGSYIGQLCYTVSAACGANRIVMVSYEALWSQPGGWDYLTEENAARSVALLPELVEYLIQLPERIGDRTRHRS